MSLKRWKDEGAGRQVTGATERLTPPQPLALLSVLTMFARFRCSPLARMEPRTVHCVHARGSARAIRSRTTTAPAPLPHHNHICTTTTHTSDAVPRGDGGLVIDLGVGRVTSHGGSVQEPLAGWCAVARERLRSTPSPRLATFKTGTAIGGDNMKVVVSIGGSVLAPELDPDRVRDHAAVIERLVDDGCTVGAVVGGGGVAREYIGVARDLGANEVELDQVGIQVTRLNARLLIAALGGEAAPRPPEDYERAGEALRRDDICVMGGVTPGQTTDAVGAALAEYIDADLLIYATSVPGVFDADPNEDASATKFDRLSGAELVDVIAGLEMDAGSSAPVDLLAAKLIQRAEMRTIVLDGTAPERIADAVLFGDHDGTDIIPEGAADRPTYWAQR